MKNDDLIVAVADFLGSFEVVFKHDWQYTKEKIGDEEPGCTFLEPGITDEIEDWGARGELLENYRKLKAVLHANGIAPRLSRNWQNLAGK